MLDRCIVECYNDEQRRWRIIREANGIPRFRDDKAEANHVSTVNTVLEGIDAVSKQDLLNVAPAIKASRHREAERKTARVVQREVDSGGATAP